MRTMIILCALALTGCASDYRLYADASAKSEIARHNADAAKYRAMADIAAQGDASAKVAAVMAITPVAPAPAPIVPVVITPVVQIVPVVPTP